MSKLTKKKTETLYAKMVREEKAMQIAAHRVLGVKCNTNYI